MYYSNYYPYSYRNRIFNMNKRSYSANTQIPQKDIVSNNIDTIPFQDFYNASDNDNAQLNDESSINSNEESSSEKNKGFCINIFGISLELDDLIIIALIFLLFQDTENNLVLIIILGMMLLNINLSDLLNIF